MLYVKKLLIQYIVLEGFWFIRRAIGVKYE